MIRKIRQVTQVKVSASICPKKSKLVDSLVKRERCGYDPQEISNNKKPKKRTKASIRYEKMAALFQDD